MNWFPERLEVLYLISLELLSIKWVILSISWRTENDMLKQIHIFTTSM